jgi:hypothetical protein
MARPSIFSKDYERHKRRRKKAMTFVVILILASAGIFLASGSIKHILLSKAEAYKSTKLFSVFKREKKDEIESTSVVEEKPTPEAQTTTETPAKVEEEKGYDIALSDGTKVKAVYIASDAGNKFKYILPLGSPVSFNINPSGTNMVIMDAAAQEMQLVDINGNVQDITKTKYTYTNKEDGKTSVFNKEDVLEKYKEVDYVWCTSPKFIDDENIAYLSQLPYVSSKKKEKFLWAVNIKNNDKHEYKYALNGENLRLGNTSEKGIELTLDNGTVKFIKLVDGEIRASE